MHVAELPYKSPQNLLWMYEGLQQAYSKDARIMLGGMFGNGTVSFDNTKIYYAWLFQRGKWIKLYSEVKGLNRRKHYTKKSVLVTTAKEALGVGKIKTDRKQLFENSFVKQSYLEKYDADERIYQWYKRYEKCSYSYKAYRESFITMDVLRHYGEFAQKNSLYTGVIVRDPTRDKRMIEFIAGIPYDQFTHDGYQRRLISEYMKDIVPEHIINQKGIGRQSADQKERLLKHQEEIKKEWMEIYRNHRGNRRIDVEKAMNQLQLKSFEELTDFELVRHIFTIILLEYTSAIEKKEI
jgi:asparagine synthase (glutamine-hydrolysing)